MDVNLDYLFRIILSAMCGFAIGFEREKRLKNAGIRTHIIVAISSALMMIVSKYGFYDVLESGLSVDASRRPLESVSHSELACILSG